MQLISENTFIYVLLIFTMIFFAGYGLIVYGFYNTPEGTQIPLSDQRSAIVHEQAAHGDQHETGASHGEKEMMDNEPEHQEHH